MIANKLTTNNVEKLRTSGRRTFRLVTAQFSAEILPNPWRKTTVRKKEIRRSDTIIGAFTSLRFSLRRYSKPNALSILSAVSMIKRSLVGCVEDSNGTFKAYGILARGVFEANRSPTRTQAVKKRGLLSLRIPRSAITRGNIPTYPKNSP
jgi:hypothetical protein